VRGEERRCHERKAFMAVRRGSRLAHPSSRQIPALVHGQEGVLRELLRLEPVAGHQTERLEQSLLLTFGEGLELLDLIVGDKGRLHGV
jgi:hypothetical protein